MHDLAPRLAELLTTYNVPIKRGELVAIHGSPEATPLIEAIARAVIDRGGHVYPMVQLPELAEYLFTNGTPEQLKYTSPITEFINDKVDVLFSIEAPMHTKALISVPAENLGIRSKATGYLNKKFIERIATKSIRWNGCAYPTRAQAQEANMGFLAFQKFVYEAYGLHLDDPIAYWNEMRDRQTRYAEWLNGKKRVEVRGPGIDLSFDVAGRSWVSCHGEMNFPDGEIFTGPVEPSVNGRVEFNFPAFHMGREVQNAAFTFKDGKIVEASASKGEDVLLSQLDVDEGARYLGEFAVGTNRYIQNMIGSTLFDEKIGGTIHMAIGHSLPDTGGENVSAIHWDMVHNMREGGQILVDGELIYQNGEFLLN
ncbi:MAG: aminopeptidase [Chloroflexi bacterium]|nr:aminopeptidase [Chloroflexota bacterium]